MMLMQKMKKKELNTSGGGISPKGLAILSQWCG